MSWVRELQLTNFRCYEQARLSDMEAGPVVLYGPNGAGKTNALEAVSLLSPGRGLRGAKIGEIQRRTPSPQRGEGGGEGDIKPEARHALYPPHPTLSPRGEGFKPWSISASLETPYGKAQIGTGRDPVKDTRLVRINGAAARGQNALAEYLSCVWLTPQMDGLFIDAASSRRRFLDRLVFAFDPSHSGRVTRYENAMRQRSRLLQEGSNNGRRADPAWLGGLEETMAETGVAIVAARADFTVRLQSAGREDEGRAFPLALLRAAGTIEELLQNSPALEVEQLFKYQLEHSRGQDAVSGGAATGPHKSDLTVRYAAKDMPADQCSTGEQKALLIGIVLAHSRLIKAEKGAPPILLLDEVAAHLDDARRAALYDILLSLGGQVWLTGTDKELFRALYGRAAFYTIRENMPEKILIDRVA